ncbi:hypothetical protein AVEN_259906-1 [Araneus ventricosus]|uniref:Uncharacterized protein n=1 Tax=Araneus ventricosus TaxID=182803 RepID=A0A4Y2IZQ1_ARAVE|nr:hypothetical protein AVEN_259906-1 [Araneus ventricosus]
MNRWCSALWAIFMQLKLSTTIHTTEPSIQAKTTKPEYSWGYVFGGSHGCSVLWTSIQQKLSTTIDATEPRIQAKTARLDYVSKPQNETVEELNCDVLPLSPYSADVSLSDYHLFRLMSHCFPAQCFHSYENIKKSQFVDSL